MWLFQIILAWALLYMAFRCLKSIDLQVRPIRHRTAEHVRAHIFRCMLAYYVEWHLRKALSPVLFQDDDLDTARWVRDPVAKPEPSAGVREKKRTRTTPEGWPVHNLKTLLIEMGTRCRNTCRAGEDKLAVHFEQLTEPTPYQKHIFDLLGLTS